MLGTLLIVIFTLALIHAFRTGFYRVSWGMDPGRALTVLIAVLIMMAFAMGFVDL
jgi:uncharacterized membrane protein YidH (DUF202 family)